MHNVSQIVIQTPGKYQYMTCQDFVSMPVDTRVSLIKQDKVVFLNGENEVVPTVDGLTFLRNNFG